ncbi:uncharacterized protein [Euwallacea fornicatus]|uniref:uncharacterized protein n=1 Tax=Euwallacea fornicatus TaxID=995702 RepID=UPI00338EDF8A
MSKTNFDPDRFLIEIEHRPAIWDSRSTEYSNKLLRGRAWEEICIKFVPTFEIMSSSDKNKAAFDMQRKWKSFRDCFRRELAKMKKTKSGSSAETGRKEYMYFKQLQFLLPICETKPQEEETVNEGEFSLRDTEEEITSVTQHSLSQKRKKQSPASDEHQHLIQTLTKFFQQKTDQEEVDDPDKHFLLSLLPYFKGLPDECKLDVQIEFLDTLKRYKQQFVSSPLQHKPILTECE